MNLPKIDLSEAIATLLARGEPLSAAQLAAATGKSASSISLAVKALGDRVHRIGAARSTRYALKQDVLGLQPQQRLSWEDSEGIQHNWGDLMFLHANWLHTRSPHQEWLTHHVLPWFLTSIRARGFLGRSYARIRPDLPSDPDQWSLAQILYIAAQYQTDPPGAFSISPLEGRIIDEVDTSAEQRLKQYDQRSQQIGSSLPAASSAGGEQPKFLSEYSHGDGWRQCIVKFTPPHGTPFGQRWRALLMLERLALQTLSEHRIAAASTHLLHSAQRTYLESVRFDRIGMHGKQHVVAIAALHDEFVQGNWKNWVHTSEALAKQGMITPEELAQIASIHAFGHYIGNTDMHSGNLSFFVDDIIAPKIRLAPVYDMLPMMWKPDVYQGALSDSPVRQQLMPAGFAQEQAHAREWAVEFWEQAATLDIGADLQAASLESARRLQTNFADV
jgi:HipA-like C-terminal domain